MHASNPCSLAKRIGKRRQKPGGGRVAETEKSVNLFVCVSEEREDGQKSGDG
jgi:hypothetical protein